MHGIKAGILTQPLAVLLVVLTGREFRFGLFISQLLAKAIPVRGAKLEKPAQVCLSGLFAFPFGGKVTCFSA
ncbi:hypothetical protein [Serratia plymuthica]|uniref:hypothetical protein n=1 Tax=Serratia TaxID=613 RepID=UPI000C1FB9B4|nr:hypothetical protein [Serratia plymuthica]MEB6538902.1 hypothetical protein [Serratia plymuthica]UJE00093.1 hypothetical protein FS592_16535 [Serratia plymuthica]